MAVPSKATIALSCLPRIVLTIDFTPRFHVALQPAQPRDLAKAISGWCRHDIQKSLSTDGVQDRWDAR